MKTKTKLFGIAALVAAIGFSIISCDTGGGDSPGVPVRVRAHNNEGSAPSLSVVSRNIMPPSYSIPANQYSSLGVFSRGITPTKFQVIAQISFYDASGDRVDANHVLLDFAQGGNTIPLSVEIPAGITCTKIGFHYFMANHNGVTPVIEFDCSGFVSDFNSSNAKTNFDAGSSGNIARLQMLAVQPSVNSITGLDFSAVVFDSNASSSSIGSYNGVSAVFVPFDPVTVNGPVTIHTSWDLTNIISQYGAAESSRFVLKNEFWNGLQIYATQ